MIARHFENLQSAAEKLSGSYSPVKLIIKLLFPRRRQKENASTCQPVRPVNLDRVPHDPRIISPGLKTSFVGSQGSFG